MQGPGKLVEEQKATQPYYYDDICFPLYFICFMHCTMIVYMTEFLFKTTVMCQDTAA
jgi:hypothetical protein